MDNVTIMACWHRRYSLGDTIQDQQPCDFWLRLVQENVPPSEVLTAAEAGELSGIRIAPNEEDAKLVDVYTSFESDEVREYEAERKDTVARCLMEELTTEHCMRLLEPYAVWLPLWLYDALKQLAAENNRSLTGYIRRVLWKHVEEQEEP